MKSIVKLGFFLFIACVLALTTPDSSTHNAAIASKFRNQNKLLSIFIPGNHLADSATDFHDLGFCSVKTFDDKLVSFGAFNHVYVLTNFSIDA